MTVQLQYLFDDIPYTALAAAERRDICGDMPDLRGRVAKLGVWTIAAAEPVESDESIEPKAEMTT